MKEVIDQTAVYVKDLLEGEGSGHDWFHILRVWNNTKHLAKLEGANLYVRELGALLHDIADWKFHDGDLSVGPKKAREYLVSLNVQPGIIDRVCYIVGNVSFKGAKVDDVMDTLERTLI